MKIFAFTFFLFLSIFSSENDAEKIAWSENHKLTWSDFKGTPEAIGDYVASTSSGMSVSFSFKTQNGKTEGDVTVICNFYPNRSWFQPGKVTPYILKHEQTHFDISELHARKLRKRISKIEMDVFAKAKIEQLYHSVEEERKQMQKSFDKETNHSKYKKLEEDWEHFVASELKKYEAWK